MSFGYYGKLTGIEIDELPNKLNTIEKIVNDTSIKINTFINELPDIDILTSFVNKNTENIEKLLYLSSSINDINDAVNTTYVDITNMNSSIKDTILYIHDYIDTSISLIDISLLYIDLSINDIYGKISGHDTSIIDIISDTSIINSSIANINASINAIDSSYLKSITYTRHTDPSVFATDGSVNENSYLFDTYKISYTSNYQLYDISLNVINKHIIPKLYNMNSSIADLYEEMDNMSAVYKPNSGIPDTAAATTLGNLSGKKKSELYDKSFSELFDQILFKDVGAFYTLNTNNNKLSPASDSYEVGTALISSMFTGSAATALYGYPSSSLVWSIGNVSVLKNDVSLGTNSNVASCTFTLNWNNNYPTLTTMYGSALESIKITKNESTTKYASVTGYYNWAWFSSNNKDHTVTESFTSFTKSTVSSTSINVVVNSTEQTSYVYILLPERYNITDILVQDPLVATKYNSCKNFTKINETSMIITALSSSNKYYIWRAGKANNNADSTVTANNKPIKLIASS